MLTQLKVFLISSTSSGGEYATPILLVGTKCRPLFISNVPIDQHVMKYILHANM